MFLWWQFSPWFFGRGLGETYQRLWFSQDPCNYFQIQMIILFTTYFTQTHPTFPLIRPILFHFFFSNLAFLPVRGHYRSDQRFTRQPAMSSKSIPPPSGCGFPRSWRVWWDGSVQEIWLLLWQHLLRESKPFLVAHGNQGLNTRQLTQMFHSVNAPELQGWDSWGRL